MRTRLKATKIANPPSRGMGWLWTFLSPGRSIAPSLLEILLTRGVSKKEKTEANTNRTKYLSMGYKGER